METRFARWVAFAIGRLDLRFSDKTAESQFKQTLEDRVLYAGLLIDMFFIFGYFVEVFLGNSLGGLSNKPEIYRALASFTCSFGFPMLFSIMIALRLKCSSFNFLDAELLVVSGITLSSLAVPWTTGWIAAHLFDKAPDEVFNYDTRGGESFVVLFLDAIATIVCLFLPLRMCVKWLPPFCGIISFITSAILFPSPFPSNLLFNMFVLCCLVFCALCGAWQNEQVARQNFISQSIVRKSSRQLELQHASNSRILERLCDTLLHLDNSFHILDPDPRFDALLLRQNRDVRASSFLDFLASDHDRKLFTSALNGRVSSSNLDDPRTSTDGLVQVSLRDMHGREFAVYVYHASIYDIESKCGHMVALVEVQERVAPVPDGSQQEQDVSWNHFEKREERSDDQRTFDNTSSGSEVPLPLIEGRTAEVIAWLDMSTSDLKVVNYSAGFTIFGPIAEGASLTRMLSKRTDSFRKWLEKMDNKFRNDEPIAKADAYKVKLKPLPHKKVEFSAMCHLDCDSLASIDEDHVLAVSFKDVRCHYRRSLSEDRAPSPVMRAMLRGPAVSL